MLLSATVCSHLEFFFFRLTLLKGSAIATRGHGHLSFNSALSLRWIFFHLMQLKFSSFRAPSVQNVDCWDPAETITEVIVCSICILMSVCQKCTLIFSVK